MSMAPEGRRSRHPLMPDDARRALLVGRAWSSAAGGPLPLLVRDGQAIDIRELAPTVSQLFEQPDLPDRLRKVGGSVLGEASRVLGGERWLVPEASLQLLAPVDLQCLKACGVTFAVSVFERVVEEQARGDLESAEEIRRCLRESLCRRLAEVRPGSEQAARMKTELVADGLWSQYLEVAIGPDAEVFTKAPLLSAVGWGDWVGIREDSNWNNPEPEIVVVCNSEAHIVGATLGNDVNLRDFEGRSALLLGKGKDNNASAALGPFIRVFDEDFSLDDIRAAPVRLTVEGRDGFKFTDESSLAGMSRTVEELVAQTCGPDHRYPDGFALYLGSPIAPTRDRDEPGKGFTHHPDDIVTVSSPRLGSLVNRVTYSSQAPPWHFGVAALMENLARRGLLARD
jgi:fumarylacetoacetate (FAA) hydrolase family protein